ncbi:hypothetical protein ACELLULO517_10855 [Acidisoma cellulosilytica]|uniref:Glutamine amidotransferase domain-containing protein n=1 Tax=Acidisoma cellulosilyticum TaxID=2802395 RepID=A0A963Z0Q8_9PROT|nr:hypothetical protein [Acidisoma cellulosilyticum]MCB8880732.1 hypothetical protein [Acidisoma cellulosilyticum]
MNTVSTVVGLNVTPALPLWVLLVLGVAGLIVLIPAFLNRTPGRWWRLLLLALLLGWLSGPKLVRQHWRARPDIALLVVDHSGSETIRGRMAQIDAARAQVSREAAAIPGLELRTITVPETGSQGTQLFAAINTALGDIPPDQLAGVVALSDGEISDIPVKPGFTAPFHLLLPAKGEETDRRLRLIDAPRYGVIGSTITLRYEVEDLGPAPAGGTATVTAMRDGAVLSTSTVPAGQVQTLILPVKQEGPSVIVLKASGLDGEASPINNQQIVTINGVRDRLRVLLISGQPDPGERAWRRLLKSDPAVDLVHFTILRPPDKDDLTPLDQLALIAFPERELFEQKIANFDLIILDRFQNQGILPSAYLSNIARYVRQGGALLLEAGPEFAGAGSIAHSDLGSILPAQPVAAAQGNDASLGLPAGFGQPAVSGAGITTAQFRPALTDMGLRHPVTADLPGVDGSHTPDWGQWYRLIDTTDVQGQVLMTGPANKPLLILDHVGQGRVGLLLSDQIWLWARDHDGGGPQAELLRRVAHWLMKEPALDENRLSAVFDGDRLHIDQRQLQANAPPAVTITNPDGQTSQRTMTAAGPGHAVLDVPAYAPGLWTVSDGTRTAYAASDMADPPEWADLRATATKAGGIVAATRGSAHFLGAGGTPGLRLVEAGNTEGGQEWIGLRRNHAHVTTGIALTPLLPGWAALPLLILVLLVAWRREGR